MYNGSTVVLLDSVFTENSANNGGGAYVEVCESSIYSGNTFTGNTATHSGGGLFQIKCSGETAALSLLLRLNMTSVFRIAMQAMRSAYVSCRALSAAEHPS